MPGRVVWLHDDCLWPAASGLPAGSFVYVFDEEKLRSAQWSLKRIGFIYECLLEIPDVQIRRGNVVEEVIAATRELDAGEVVTAATPDPRTLGQIAELRQRLQLIVLEPPAFVELSGRVDLKRFSRYWQKAEPLLLRDTLR
ncbi:MAG: hypothetical protein H7039_17065 [Bryobacteraceae bacterium]|nr:hypothetical protein [Bryobacteraceae bacterium]